MADIRWEDDIFGKVAQSDWIDVGAQVPTRQTDPIDGLFGDTKTENLVAHWETIASEYQIPMMAQFHGFDTEAKTTFRVPIDSHNIEKGLIKVKLNQSERLRALRNRGVIEDEALYNYVLDDGIRLADQVITRTKVAKNELMATGQITIVENDLNLTVDYGVPSAQKSLTLDLGAGASDDVLTQLQNIIDMASDAGVTLNGIMTSSKNITKLRKNESLQKAVYGTLGAGALLTNAAVSAFLNEEYGITQIVTNDLQYGASATGVETGRPTIIQKRYYPQDKITFFATNPKGQMGIGLWGNPPEVDMGQFYPEGGSSISPYVFITQKMEWDPAVLWTKASGLFMPVLYNPNSLFIASVTETQGA